MEWRWNCMISSLLWTTPGGGDPLVLDANYPPN